MKLTKYDYIMGIIYLTSLFLVSSLSYNQGEYSGMEQICGEKEIYLNYDEFKCYTEEEAKEIMGNRQSYIDYGGLL